MPVDPRVVQPTIAFDAESESAALGRYAGFGLAVFDALWLAHPQLRDGFQFFRDPRTNDIWSFCNTATREFGLQLDPDIEVICLWDGSEFIEIGTWSDDPRRGCGCLGDRTLHGQLKTASPCLATWFLR